MIYCFIQSIYKFEEIFLVQKDFVLLVTEVIPIHSSLAFGDGQVIIVTTGRLDIKKISSFSCFYFL